MKYSYKWLKQLIDFDKTPQELADDLSCKSIEIENIENFGGDFLDTVVVGEIVSIEKHPNADKLSVVKVNIENKNSNKFGNNSGLDSDLIQVVCGAPNIEVGQKVPVALVGTLLRQGSEGQASIEIKKSEIRGIESNGMLCAEDELELGSDHAGILILDPEIEIGTKLSDIYNDIILEGAIQANRGDLANHVGLAREIAAIYGGEIKQEIKKAIKQEGDEGLDFVGAENFLPVQVEIANLEACPLYTAQLIKGVKIAPSPYWMQQVLLACGMKPINNIVDVTNYVMLEYGNPLHAFDAKKLQINGNRNLKVDSIVEKNDLKSGGLAGAYKIIVRLSEKGESIRTLDGKDHELPEGLLCVCDENKPVAVAGVMGGENSEIDEGTTDIILESATFSSAFIRKSEMALGLKTEASSRFAKGLSRQLALMGLERATQLFEEICGGKAEGKPVFAGDIPREKSPVTFDFDKIRNFLSIDISDSEAVKILENLGFKVDGEKVVAPLWREDVSIWQDIAEEVGRIYGLDKVRDEKLTTETTPETAKLLYFEENAKKFLSSTGLTEIYTMSILPSDLTAKTGMEEFYFEIDNPLNEFDKIMRSGLWNGLLLHASENAKKFDHFGFFDISKVYLPSDNKNIPSNEEIHLAILLYGEKPDEGLFVLRSYLDNFAQNFGLSFSYQNAHIPNKTYMHPGRSANIFLGEKQIGQICEIHPMVRENLDLKERAWVAEINLELLVGSAENIDNKFSEIESDVIFKEFSRFEVVKRDIAVLVDGEADANEVAKSIKEADNMIVSAELFDEFLSDKFGAGRKSLAYHLVFQSSDHTLTDQETDMLFNKVVEILNNKYKAELRK